MGLLLGRSKGRRTLDKVEGFSTCIGADSVFKGTITGPGHCIIHGKVEGRCDMEGTLIVGEQGEWIGDINAAVVLIAGQVTGDIHASDKMEIVSTAKVKGKISSAVLAIAEGAIHEGQIQMTSSSPATRFTDKRDSGIGNPAADPGESDRRATEAESTRDDDAAAEQVMEQTGESEGAMHGDTGTDPVASLDDSIGDVVTEQPYAGLDTEPVSASDDSDIFVAESSDEATKSDEDTDSGTSASVSDIFGMTSDAGMADASADSSGNSFDTESDDTGIQGIDRVTPFKRF